MFLGRFAVAMAGKKFASTASLGTLVLSTQFADCLWPVLLLLGIEQVRIVPGTTRVTPLDFISYPISHSLLLQLVWGLLLGGAYFFWRRDLRTAPVVGALLPTHWLLDYFAHRPDMPLYPGGPKVGLGMWNSLPLTLLVEFGLFLIGLLVYLTATRSKGPRELWSLVLCPLSGCGLCRFPARATASQRSHGGPERVGAMADGSLDCLGGPPARTENRLTSDHEKNILRKMDKRPLGVFSMKFWRVVRAGLCAAVALPAAVRLTMRRILRT